MTTTDRILAVVVGLILALLVYTALTPARSHDTMGERRADYLWGHRIGAPRNGMVINCCKYTPGGDCHALRGDARPVEVEGGWRLATGEFVPADETSASPDGQFYGCNSWSGAASHCLFVPLSGT